MLLSKNKKIKVAIVAGGTGGHVFPAISLVEELIKQKNEVIFVSDPRVKKIIFENKDILKKKFIKFYILNISKKFKNIFSNILSFFKIFFILIRERPNVIVGFGGYTSFTTLLSAKILLKPIVLHEQNIQIGFVNKLFLPIAKKIILGWGDEKNFNFSNNKKYFFIRNPVRRKIILLRRKLRFKFKQDKIILLVIGGSQGSIVLGKVIPDALKLIPRNLRKKIYVYHQCAKQNIMEIKKKYISINLKATCKVFFNDLPDIMFKSDLVISRAGASSLSEVTALGKPAILIPYKFAKNDHQIKNAKWFVEKGAGTLLREEELNSLSLKKKILEFLTNISKLKKAAKKSYQLGDPESVKKILKLIND